MHARTLMHAQTRMHTLTKKECTCVCACAHTHTHSNLQCKETFIYPLISRRDRRHSDAFCYTHTRTHTQPSASRLIYLWHTGKEVGHFRSYLLFELYLELMCTYLHIMSLGRRPFEINIGDFEPLLGELTIREWKDLNQIHPHDASEVMRTYHTRGRQCCFLSIRLESN